MSKGSRPRLTPQQPKRVRKLLAGAAKGKKGILIERRNGLVLIAFRGADRDLDSECVVQESMFDDYMAKHVGERDG